MCIFLFYQNRLFHFSTFSFSKNPKNEIIGSLFHLFFPSFKKTIMDMTLSHMLTVSNTLHQDFRKVCKKDCPFRLTCHTLHMAIARRHSDCFKNILLEMEKNMGSDAYHLHAILTWDNSFDCAKNIFCLEIDAVHRNTVPLLYYVASERATDSKISFQKEIEKMIRFLAFNGVDINQKLFGETLLHHSIRRENFFLVEIAMELHADPFIKNDGGYIPMELFQFLPKSYNPEMIEEREKMQEMLQEYMDMYLYDVKTPDI